MKRFTSLFVLTLLNSLAFAQGNFTVKGNFKNYDGKVYFFCGDKKDSVNTENGNFLFSGRVNNLEEGRITLPDKKMILGISTFWIDSGKTILEIDTVSINQKGFNEAVLFNTKIIQSGKTNQFLDSVKTYIDKIKAEPIAQDQKDHKVKLAVDNLIQEYPNSIISVYILSANLSYYDEEELKKIYANLDESLKSNRYAFSISKKYSKKIDAILGEKIPNFVQNNQYGKPISVSSFRGKYLLIEFWASWCVPCRAENPTVLKAYQKFKGKGFDILSVSIDEDKDAWLKAIKEDGLPWTQVSDLKGAGNQAYKMFKITSIPSNILIDREGKIIIVNLRGSDLNNKLEEIFSSK